MASISFVRGRWRAQVRTARVTRSRSFQSKRDAQRWAVAIETAADPPRKDVRLRDLIARFEQETDGLGRSVSYALRAVGAALGDRRYEDVTVDEIVAYGLSRRVEASTLHLDLHALGKVLQHARLVWRMGGHDPMPDARKLLRARLANPKARDRRPSPDELERLCAHFDAHGRLPWRDLIWFSIHTSMRLGEVCRIRWADLDGATILIRDRKDPRRKLGNHQRVPLLPPALEIIRRQPARSERIFPLAPRSISSKFTETCARLQIVDLHWHDLRHEAISRLFEMGMSVPEVALFSGHRDWRHLARYTQLKADTVAKKWGVSLVTKEPSLPSPV